MSELLYADDTLVVQCEPGPTGVLWWRLDDVTARSADWTDLLAQHHVLLVDCPIPAWLRVRVAMSMAPSDARDVLRAVRIHAAGDLAKVRALTGREAPPTSVIEKEDHRG